MKTKKCSKYKTIKHITEFSKYNSDKDGIRCWCKECRREYQKEYRQSHKKERKEYCLTHKNESKGYNKTYYQSNKEKIAISGKKYRQSHKLEIAKRMKEYQQFNRKKRNKLLRQRRKKDLNFRLLGNLRNRIREVLKRNSKSLSTMFLIGCSVEYLMYHLQCNFSKGMNWNNYGYYGWHVDHIAPCESFDLSKPEEQRECFHYNNLQPLWAEDNLLKRKEDNIKKHDKKKG